MVRKVRNRRKRSYEVYSYYATSTITPPTEKQVVCSHQGMQSQENFWFQNRKVLNQDSTQKFFDIGANFLSQKVEVVGQLEVITQLANFHKASGSWLDNLQTLIVPSLPVKEALELYRASDTLDQYAGRVTSFTPTPRTDIDLDAAGATAVSRCIPTNPVVDLATSIAETVTARKLFSVPGSNKSASGEYLNYQLGIAPVISDLKDTHEAITTQEAVLKQHERDSGRLIRRRYAFPEEESVVLSKTENVYPSFIGPAMRNSFAIRPGTLDVETRKINRTWFSGAFTYYLPKSGWRRTLAQQQRLYGIVPGLETAYNVVPYSFVADYFVNLGDVLHNVDAFTRDGLIMPYGYIMSSQEERTRYTWRGPVKQGESFSEHVISNTIIRSTKQRRRANPFGFGLSEGNLSLRQVSILAALGLNRK